MLRCFGILGATIVFLGLGAATLPAAQEVPVATAPASGLTRDLLDDVRDGALQRLTLTGAALVASGVENAADLEQYERAVRHKLSVCKAAARQITEAPARSHLALAFLHTQFLTGQYSPECTELHTTLNTGDYNCVTATVLYLAVCQELEVEAVAISTPGHVYARVRLASEDLQTTASGPTESTPWASGDRSNTKSTAREITPVELLGKIYYNRAVAALEVRDYSVAVRRLRLALVCDSHDSAARENLLAALNNWALAESAAGRFTAADAVLKEARSMNSKWPALLVNDVNIHQRWAVALWREGRQAEAIAHLAQCADRRPDTRAFAEAREALEKAGGAR